MTALALNLLALLIVLGMCWGAMMWLSGRFHGQRGSSGVDYETMVFDDGAKKAREDETDVDRGSSGTNRERPGSAPAPCTTCEGVGATHEQGKLAPCPQCYGTGVLA